MIRAARLNELPALQEIERAAGICFADIGMVAVAEDDPPSLETLREFHQDGRLWVWVREDDYPAAYAMVDVVDGNVHLEQVSVHPDHAGKRIGQALIEHAATWARARDITAMTLTTFTEVVWNGPYYERLGFHYLAVDEETAGLRTIRKAEAAHGLDAWPRACMRRDLEPAT
ncbi:GNAT family N-acetyltransferase [Rhodococcus marinonascens]|uniref:GNAT family N-acetyltransferase n=1 Tax=Rhodococcus marinonascens TaxID=38311 RepID=UPI000933E3BF|nr:GNAT family N-acetyltransferase [Rhodococcus marinonascens]